jgi:hypothetical protein
MMIFVIISFSDTLNLTQVTSFVYMERPWSPAITNIQPTRTLWARQPSWSWWWYPFNHPRQPLQQFTLVAPPPVQQTRAGTDSTEEVTLIVKSPLSTDKKLSAQPPLCPVPPPPHTNHGIRDDKVTSMGSVNSSRLKLLKLKCLRHVLGQDKWQKFSWTCQFVRTCCKFEICPQMSMKCPQIPLTSILQRGSHNDIIWGRVLPTLPDMSWHFPTRQNACPLRKLWGHVLTQTNKTKLSN